MGVMDNRREMAPQMMVQRWVLCCPKCQGVNLRYKGPKTPQSVTEHWLCFSCSHRWKAPIREVERGNVIA